MNDHIIDFDCPLPKYLDICPCILSYLQNKFEKVLIKLSVWSMVQTTSKVFGVGQLFKKGPVFEGLKFVKK